MRLIYFDSLPSTNQYAKLLTPDEGGEFSVVWSRSQTQGVGQRGNSWLSEPGKNLTFSIILFPSFLHPANQFLLTKVLALGVTDWLAATLPSLPVSIKWPNDIYVGYKKIGGILVENTISSHYDRAVCGIGFNVNQTLFPSSLPNPVSLRLLSDSYFDLETTLRSICSSIAVRYESLKMGLVDTLDADYWRRLLWAGQMAPYRYHGDPVRAKSVAIDTFGRLLLLTDDDRLLCCDLKELQWILP